MSNKKFASPQVLPVLDLLRGRVVGAVAGERNIYQPVSSELAASSDPATVAGAFRERFGFREAYVADLDAIAGAAPDWESINAVGQAGFRIWLDAGLRTAEQAIHLAERSLAHGNEEAKLSAVVVGSETAQGLVALQQMLEAIGHERLVFSLDLKAGQPLGSPDFWNDGSPEKILESALSLGVRRFLILDLAQVGTQSGTHTEPLCRKLRGMSEDIEIAAGGGVRDAKDIRSLYLSGCDVVLVASAFHAGRISREDLDALE